MICKCGTDVVTPYCPQCGNVCSSPLMALLAHCRKVARHQRSQAQTISEKHPEQSVRVGGYLEAADKWEEWAKALEDLVITKVTTEE